MPAQIHAGGVVSNCVESELRTALDGGGTVTFTCDGSITLAETLTITQDTTLDASGHNMELSGGNAVRVFRIMPGVRLTLIDLGITQGRGALGGGVYNDAGYLNAIGCTFSGNQAVGTNSTTYNLGGESAAGGAIFSSGSIQLRGCLLSTNLARGGNGAPYSDALNPNGSAGGNANGGAIYSTGLLALAECRFQGNQTVGGAGGAGEMNGAGGIGGTASGGAIDAADSCGLTNCVFYGNKSAGGVGGSGYTDGQGGSASGGAVSLATGSLHQVRCTFDSNSSQAGTMAGSRYSAHGHASGGAITIITGSVTCANCLVVSNTVQGEAAQGGGISQNGGLLTISTTRFSGNRAVGYRADTYDGRTPLVCQGGGLHSAAQTSITDSTLSLNSVTGSDSGNGVWPEPGGRAFGGGMSSHSILELRRCTLSGNTAVGGLGSFAFAGFTSGGAAHGGGLGLTNGAALIENCTITTNTATGGAGQVTGPGGSAYGGGILFGGTNLTVTHCTIQGNGTSPGAGGGGVAYGAGLSLEHEAALLRNTIVTENSPAENISGTFQDENNLIGVDARLSSLAFNGGATWTMALLPDSPAIDSASPAYTTQTDQRGFPRPQGAAPDMGAFERDTSTHTDFLLRTLEPAACGWRVTGTGPPATPFHLQSSSDLRTWSSETPGQTGNSGWFEAELDPAASAHFFRVVSP